MSDALEARAASIRSPRSNARAVMRRNGVVSTCWSVRSAVIVALRVTAQRRKVTSGAVARARPSLHLPESSVPASQACIGSHAKVCNSCVRRSCARRDTPLRSDAEQRPPARLRVGKGQRLGLEDGTGDGTGEDNRRRASRSRSGRGSRDATRPCDRSRRQRSCPHPTPRGRAAAPAPSPSCAISARRWASALVRIASVATSADRRILRLVALDGQGQAIRPAMAPASRDPRIPRPRSKGAAQKCGSGADRRGSRAH